MRAKNINFPDSVDLLSYTPTCLLHHILSMSLLNNPNPHQVEANPSKTGAFLLERHTSMHSPVDRECPRQA